MIELTNLEKIPAAVRSIVEPYAQNLLGLMDENICSITIFGSGIGKDFIPGKSNVNLLVVCKHLDITDLKKCHNLIYKGRKKGIVAPLFLTKNHMETSSDVFPIEFLDMKDFHQVIYGEDFFDNLRIGTENLRLECEEQLKGKLIRLRQSYLEVGTNPKILSNVIGESITSLVPVFRGVLRLIGKETVLSKIEVLNTTSKEFEVDSMTLSQALDIKTGKVKLRKEETEDFFGKYMTEIEKLAIAVDRLETSDSINQGNKEAGYRNGEER